MGDQIRDKFKKCWTFYTTFFLFKTLPYSLWSFFAIHFHGGFDGKLMNFGLILILCRAMIWECKQPQLRLFLITPQLNLHLLPLLTMASTQIFRSLPILFDIKFYKTENEKWNGYETCAKIKEKNQSFLLKTPLILITKKMIVCRIN